MSSPVSFGDVVEIIKIANNLRKSFIYATGRYRAISDEIKNIANAIEDVPILFDYISRNDISKVQSCVDACKDILLDLQKILDKNHVLASNDGSLKDGLELAWKKFTWPKEKVNEFENRIHAQFDVLNGLLQVTASKTIFETKRIVDELDEYNKNEERLKILDWLTPLDPSSQQSDIISQKQAGTGQYTRYQTWAEEPGKILFCEGYPGAGKTMISAIVIEDLLNQFRTNETVGIAFTFCSIRRPEEQQTEQILRSIAKQLSRTLTPLPKRLVDQYNQNTNRPSFLHSTKIDDILNDAITRLTRSFVIVDAIDECDTTNSNRNILISKLLRLVRQSKVNLLVTSRKLSAIKQHFQDNVLKIRICAKEADLNLYIDSQLTQFRAFVRNDAELRKIIKTEIIIAADKVFLYAKLLLDSLKVKMSPKAIKSSLENISKGGGEAFTKLYESAMNRIQSQSQDERTIALKLLCWITCAKRPLTKSELQHAVAVEDGDPELDPSSFSEVDDMVSVCAGLIKVDYATDNIRFVHPTAWEYFKQTQSKWFQDAADTMAGICATYLSFDTFKNNKTWNTSNAFQKLLKTYSLHSYASEHWAAHASETNGVSERIKDFLANNSCIGAAAESFLRNTNTSSGGISRLHLVAMIGYKPGAELLLSDANVEVDIKDDRNRTPLSWAAENNHADIVDMLLEHEADVNCPDNDGATPLYHATAFGSMHAIQALFKKRAKQVDANNESQGYTVLAMASARGDTELVKLLLNEGSIVNNTDGFGWTAICHAAIRGYRDVTNQLLEAGADKKFLTAITTDGTDVSPLTYALMGGSEEGFEWLLELGVNPDSADKCNRTALSYAAEFENERLIELLLEKGANPSIPDNDGRTPLDYVKKGNKDLIRRLKEESSKSG